MFVLARDRLVHVYAWAVFDLFRGQREVKLAGRPLGLAKENGRYENLASILEEGTTSLDHQIAYNPTIIVQEKVGDFSDLAVARTDYVSLDILEAS
jgi:hypothetical protein